MATSDSGVMERRFIITSRGSDNGQSTNKVYIITTDSSAPSAEECLASSDGSDYIISSEAATAGVIVEGQSFADQHFVVAAESASREDQSYLIASEPADCGEGQQFFVTSGAGDGGGSHGVHRYILASQSEQMEGNDAVMSERVGLSVPTQSGQQPVMTSDVMTYLPTDEQNVMTSEHDASLSRTKSQQFASMPELTDQQYVMSAESRASMPEPTDQKYIMSSESQVTVPEPTDQQYVTTTTVPEPTDQQSIPGIRQPLPTDQQYLMTPKSGVRQPLPTDQQSVPEPAVHVGQQCVIVSEPVSSEMDRHGVRTSVVNSDSRYQEGQYVEAPESVANASRAGQSRGTVGARRVSSLGCEEFVKRGEHVDAPQVEQRVIVAAEPAAAGNGYIVAVGPTGSGSSLKGNDVLATAHIPAKDLKVSQQAAQLSSSSTADLGARLVIASEQVEQVESIVVSADDTGLLTLGSEGTQDTCVVSNLTSASPSVSIQEVSVSDPEVIEYITVTEPVEISTVTAALDRHGDVDVKPMVREELVAGMGSSSSSSPAIIAFQVYQQGEDGSETIFELQVEGEDAVLGPAILQSQVDTEEGSEDSRVKKMHINSKEGAECDEKERVILKLEETAHDQDLPSDTHHIDLIRGILENQAVEGRDEKGSVVLPSTRLFSRKRPVLVKDEKAVALAEAALQRKRKFGTGHKTWICEVCGNGFTQVSSLKKHTAVQHRQGKTHVCDICGKACCSKSELEGHRRSHTGERPYQCHLCSNTYKHNAGLQQHILAGHLGRRPHTCGVCGRAFTEKRSLKDHLLIHSGLKPHTCSTCGKAFVQASSLKAHQRTHTGTKPFVCSVCGKRYCDQTTLKRHSLIHTGEQPHKCPHCPASFARTEKLNKHVRNEHGAVRQNLQTLAAAVATIS